MWKRLLDGYLIVLENFQALKINLVICSLGFLSLSLFLENKSPSLIEKIHIKEIHALAEANSAYLEAN